MMRWAYILVGFWGWVLVSVVAIFIIVWTLVQFLKLGKRACIGVIGFSLSLLLFGIPWYDLLARSLGLLLIIGTPLIMVETFLFLRKCFSWVLNQSIKVKWSLLMMTSLAVAFSIHSTFTRIRRITNSETTVYLINETTEDIAFTLHTQGSIGDISDKVVILGAEQVKQVEVHLIPRLAGLTVGFLRFFPLPEERHLFYTDFEDEVGPYGISLLVVLDQFLFEPIYLPFTRDVIFSTRSEGGIHIAWQ